MNQVKFIVTLGIAVLSVVGFSSAAHAQSCASFRPSLDVPVSAGFIGGANPIVNGTFKKGDLITLSSVSSINVVVTNFSVTQSQGFGTPATILENFTTSGGTAIYDVPADGFYQFAIGVGGNNTSGFAGTFGYVGDCRSTGTPGGTTGSTNAENAKATQRAVIDHSKYAGSRLGAAYLSGIAAEEDFQSSGQKPTAAAQRKKSLDNLANLERQLTKVKSRLQDKKKALAEAQKREARFYTTGNTFLPEADFYRDQIKEISDDIRNLEDIQKQLEETSDRERKRLKLPPRKESLIELSRDVIQLSYAPEIEKQKALDEAFASQPFSISTNGSFGFSQLSNELDQHGTRVWIDGGFSILTDGSAADRSGHRAQLALGVGRRINDRLAAILELNAVAGEYNVGATGSRNDITGLGGTTGIGFELGATGVNAQLMAFYNRIWVNTRTGATTGSYTASNYGLSGKLSRPFDYKEIIITPGLGLGYDWTKINGYTDSSGLVVPGSKDGVANSLASVRAEKFIDTSLDGPDWLNYWTPFAELSVTHQINSQNQLALGPGLTITDSATTSMLQVGAALNTTKGTNVSFSSFVSTGFDGGLTTIGATATIGGQF